MKKYIIPKEGTFYKANLHSHSTCSDGKMTPEAMKEIYKSAGYSVLSYSDHNVLIDHSDLNDDDFLCLLSTEIDVLRYPGKKEPDLPCYHINFYPQDPHNVTMPTFERSYEKINDVVRAFTDQGFLAMLNHPTWSQQNIEDYKDLDLSKFFAVEIYNHGSTTMGYQECNEHLFDDLLRRGNRLYCTATDDNHNVEPVDSPAFDSLGGFVMIKANALTYEAILQALKAGNFYASNGPEIYELYIEDDVLVVKTSPAAKIVLNTPIRYAKSVYPKTRDELICEARFDLRNCGAEYVRIRVVDQNGYTAWSQPVYKDL